MATVGDEVIVRGVVEESVPWGTVGNCRVRLPDGSDIWLSDRVLEAMQPDDRDMPRRMADASPTHVAHAEIERCFDDMGRNGELDPEVADHLKRRLIMGKDRAGAAPRAMRSGDLSGDRPKYAPGTAANRSGQPPSEARELEKAAEARQLRPEAHFSSPGRLASDMGNAERPPTPAVAADAHTSDTGVAVEHPRAAEEREADPGTATPEGKATGTDSAAEAAGSVKPGDKPKGKK